MFVEKLKAPVGLGGSGAAAQKQLNPNENNKAIPSIALFCSGENKLSEVPRSFLRKSRNDFML